MGLIVLILQGEVKQLTTNDTNIIEDSVDTFIGNKQTEMSDDNKTAHFSRSPYFDEIILREKEQVLPLISFPHVTSNNNELLYELQCHVQRVADKWFNHGRVTRVDRIYPSIRDIPTEHKLRVRFSQSRDALPFSFKPTPSSHPYVFKAPPSEPMVPVLPPRTLFCRSPEVRHQTMCQSREAQRYYKLVHFSNLDESLCCNLCLSSLRISGPLAVLPDCLHIFHPSCLNQLLMYCIRCSQSPMCPLCSTPIESERNTISSFPSTLVKEFGTSPGGGTMMITWSKTVQCSGYNADHGGYSVCYQFPNGIQSFAAAVKVDGYHPAPGQPYSGIVLFTYLPHTAKCVFLLERLQQAFEEGHLFYVGSLPIAPNHYRVLPCFFHKTKTTGGGFDGFPDPMFVQQSNAQLDTILKGTTSANINSNNAAA